MSRTATKTFKKTIEVEEQVTRTIMYILIEKDGNIYWQVSQFASDGVKVGDEYYCCPAAELAIAKTKGGSFYEEIQTALWVKTDEIDAMSEETIEESEDKSRYRKAFTYNASK